MIILSVTFIIVNVTLCCPGLISREDMSSINHSNHPSLKPQSFLRKIVYSALPLGEGIIFDPFMGSGSTLAAAEHLGYLGIGIERFENYYNTAIETIPKLSKIVSKSSQLELNLT